MAVARGAEALSNGEGWERVKPNFSARQYLKRQQWVLLKYN